MLRCSALFLCIAMVVAGMGSARQRSKSETTARKPDLTSGKATFLQYCASCHGQTAKGDGPAAFAMKPPPPDLTTLTKRHDGKFPTGYTGALLKFGRNLAAHGSEEMPVWGTRFRSLDPVNDPTGQHRIDDVVAYIRSFQLN